VRRYNKTATEKLWKAVRHIGYAQRNLHYGILLTDFKEQIRILSTIKDQILAVIEKEGEA